MNFIDIIENKKKGIALSQKEIKFFINGTVNGNIPDYQLSALLMAICLKGMDETETYNLTHAMKISGEVVDTSFAGGIVADKHSTGGVSDTVTPVVVPVLAAAGLKVVKMSGRGLSHTGGTIDKLESIKGFNCELSQKQIVKAVKTCGAVIISQTADLAPADKILYALRDVTATVDSIPLIASSIMSKKLASGSDIILLDVKYGNGAFMKSEEDAVCLAECMVKIGVMDKKLCAAIVTSMEQPLTKEIGCNLEIKSAIDVLKGKKDDLYLISKEICCKIFLLAGLKEKEKDAYSLFDNLIESKAALNKFEQIIKCQGGDTEIINNDTVFAKNTKILKVKGEGYISKIDTVKVGKALLSIGGGRERKSDIIDHNAGIRLHIRLNDYVKDGDTLAEIFYSDTVEIEQAEKQLNGCYGLSKNPVVLQKLIYAYVTDSKTEIL